MFGLEPPYFISYFSSGNTDCLYSDFDITDSEGNVLFQKPVLQKVVVELEKAEEILPMVNNLMTILLPVGLAIFSVVLVIYLIASKKWRPI